MGRRTEVLVIGGGSTGTAIAYYLAQRGGAKVTLVEKQRIAWGQTGLSTGVVRLHYSHEAVARLALLSHRVFERFEAEIGGQAGFVKSGFALGVAEADVPALETNVKMHKAMGIPTRLITPAELHQIEPRLNPTGLAAAVYEPESGFADPTRTAQAFAQAAQAQGATILEETTALGFSLEGARVTEVRTSRGSFAVDTVVNAAGVWANKVATLLGERLPIEIVREEIAIFRRPSQFGGVHLVYMDFPHNFYVRPSGEFDTHVGSLAPDMARRDIDPDSFGSPSYVHQEVLTQYSGGVLERFPLMASATPTGGWQGLYDVTPDWHPLLGRSERIENLYHAVGLSGHGFKLAPALGMIISDLVLRGRSDLVDSELFSAQRFARGQPIRTRYEYGVLA